MITILVTPGETELQTLLGDCALSYPLPFDCQLVTTRGPISIERKVFPSDFTASIHDGRLSRECAAMREVSQFRILIIEGRSIYNSEGYLFIGKKLSRFTRVGIRNLRRSLVFVEGCHLEDSADIKETVEILMELVKYFNESSHIGLRGRPRLEADYFLPVYRERYLYWLQGLPGISSHRAQMMAKVYSSPLALFSALYQNDSFNHTAIQVPGIGKILSLKIAQFLNGESGGKKED